MRGGVTSGVGLRGAKYLNQRWESGRGRERALEILHSIPERRKRVPTLSPLTSGIYVSTKHDYAPIAGTGSF
jgi:hypothetical protein